MGQCLSLQNHKYKCLFSDLKKDKTVEKTENVIRPIELKLKHKTTDKKISKTPPKSDKTVWDDWQRSEAANRAERSVKKMRYLTQCELDGGKTRRKIGAAYGGRRRKGANRIPNDRAKKQDRKKRRQRQMRDCSVFTFPTI